MQHNQGIINVLRSIDQNTHCQHLKKEKCDQFYCPFNDEREVYIPTLVDISVSKATLEAQGYTRGTHLWLPKGQAMPSVHKHLHPQRLIRVHPINIKPE